MAPHLVFAPESFDFGEVEVGKRSEALLTLENDGQTPLPIKGFTIEGTEDIIAIPPPPVIGAQQKAEVNLVYVPAHVGEVLAEIVIDADDEEGIRRIPARGFGVVPGLVIRYDAARCGGRAGSLSFGEVPPSTTVTRTLTLRATGSAPVRILSATLEPGSSPEYSLDALPPDLSLRPGETRTLDARYTPVDGGADTGEIRITTNAPGEGAEYRIPLCGGGVAPALCARPVPLDLGEAVAGFTTATATIALESCGLLPLDLTGIEITPESDPQHPSSPELSVSMRPALPQSLAVGQSVIAEVSFEPGPLGVKMGWLQVDSNAFGEDRAFIPIRAESARPCQLEVMPRPLAFSAVAQGATDTRPIVLSNTGVLACNVVRLELVAGSGPFRIASAPPLPFMVPAAGSVTVEIAYTPTAAIPPDKGEVQVQDADSPTPTRVELVGNEPVGSGCQIDVSPGAVSFGSTPPAMPRNVSLELRNVSMTVCHLISVQLDASSSPDFLVNAMTPATIEPGAVHNVTLTYRATRLGTSRGVVHVTTTDTDTPIAVVPLVGTAAAPGVCVTPGSLAFGAPGAPATADLQVTACGGRPVNLTSLYWLIADPELTIVNLPLFPVALAAGASRTFTVRYDPADANPDHAMLGVYSDDPGTAVVDVDVTGGPDLAPAGAGRSMMFWQIRGLMGGDLMEIPLQGAASQAAYWGPRTGKTCAGCHALSPDSRYLALVEGDAIKVVDTMTDLEVPLPQQIDGAGFISWRPDPNTNPPYQFAYDDGYVVHLASAMTGEIGVLRGADDPGWRQVMPSWGPGGKIAFVRGRSGAGPSTGQGSFGLSGPTDVLLVDQGGGVAELLVGASGDGKATYYPAYSPNGSWIAVTVSAAARTTIAALDAQLRLIKADQSGTVQPLSAINAAGGGSFATFSPDGRFLSFSSNRAGGAGDWDLYLAPIDPTTGADGPPVNMVQANTSAFEHAARFVP